MPSATVSACAYKGYAEYWSATVDGTETPDVAWVYRDPQNDAVPVKGLIGFFDERLDVTLDGQRQERPVTPWS